MQPTVFDKLVDYSLVGRATSAALRVASRTGSKQGRTCPRRCGRPSRSPARARRASRSRPPAASRSTARASSPAKPRCRRARRFLLCGRVRGRRSTQKRRHIHSSRTSRVGSIRSLRSAIRIGHWRGGGAPSGPLVRRPLPIFFQKDVQPLPPFPARATKCATSMNRRVLRASSLGLRGGPWPRSDHGNTG